jgi:hypothetical protein
MQRAIEIIDELLNNLIKVDNVRKIYGGMVIFCVDCMRWIDENELVGEDHTEHLTVFSNIDHDGILEWIRCLRYLREKIKSSLQSVHSQL